MHRLIFTLHLLCIFQAGMGQSLRDLVVEAMENNYAIRMVRNDQEMTTNANTAGNAGMLPSVGVDVSFQRNVNNTRQQFFITEDRVGTGAQTDNTNLRATASWTIFSGFRVQATREQLRLLEDLGVADSQFLIEQTVLDIADLYYQIHASRAMIRAFSDALDVSRTRLKLEKRRRETGSSGALPFNQALMDYQSDSALVLSETQTLRQLEIQLLNSLRREPSGKIEIADPVVYPECSFGIDRLQELAAQSAGELQSARILEKISDANQVMARSSMYPEVNLFGGYAFSKLTNEVGFLKSSRNYGPEFGVQIRFNLFNGGKVRIASDNAALERENARLSAEQLKSQVNAAIQQHHENMLSLSQRIQLAEQRVEIARESVAIARKQLEVGTISGIDFRTIQLEIIRAESTLASLRQAQALSTLHLLRLSGTLVNSIMKQ